MAEEELLVTLNRGDTGGGAGFGFSLLGSNAAGGLRGHHVIYDIVENSPAARSGKLNNFVRLYVSRSAGPSTTTTESDDR